MFSIGNTVLVLGAGASVPYGFPVASVLKQELLKKLGPVAGSDERLVVNHGGFGDRQIEEFAKSLKLASPGTLDEFLFRRESQRDISAFVLTCVMSDLEQEETLFAQNDWYQLLYEELELNKPEERSRIRAIVSFNYERSVEHFLHTRVEHDFDDGDRASAVEKLQTVPILHVHGSLGKYPALPYRPLTSLALKRTAAASIRRLYDTDEPGEDLVIAREHIAAAEQIILLGFSFDERNVRKLGLRDFKPETKRLGATAFQLSRATEIRESFGNLIYMGQNQTALQMLNEWNEQRRKFG